MKIHQKIDIIIDTNGSISIDAVGFSGSDCEKATAFLEQALGQAQRKQRKPEYYRQRSVNHVQKLGQ